MKTNTKMKTYKVRTTGAVLDTEAGTRQLKIEGTIRTFGREPIYLQAEKLPEKLTSDPYLEITLVDTAPPDVIVIDLKAERVQEA
jgi:hypothetical protein